MNQIFTRSLKTALLVSLTIFATGVNSQNFKIVDLQTSELTTSALNKTYTVGTSSIELRTANTTFDGSYSNACFNYETGALKFDQNGTSNYSYITIDNLGSDNITGVELTGCSNFTGGDALVFVGFSSKLSSSTTDNEYSNTLDFDAPGLTFKDSGNGDSYGCQKGSAIVTVSNPKSAKIAVTTKFGNEGYSGQKPFVLQKLTIYTDKNAETGIGETVSGNAFSTYVTDGELTFTEPASQVSIYNISGQLVQTAGNIQALPLNTLPTGIYVVKATSATGKNIITKIAR